MDDRCVESWDDVQCELPRGHTSAHIARFDDAHVWWTSGRRLVRHFTSRQNSARSPSGA